MVVLELARAGAGQGQQQGGSTGSSRAGVPKPPKNRFLKAREAQNGGFGTGQGKGSSRAAARAAAGAGFTLRAMIGSAIKEMYTRLSGGKYISYSPFSVKKVPRPWNSNAVFLT